ETLTLRPVAVVVAIVVLADDGLLPNHGAAVWTLLHDAVDFAMRGGLRLCCDHRAGDHGGGGQGHQELLHHRNCSFFDLGRRSVASKTELGWACRKHVPGG